LKTAIRLAAGDDIGTLVALMGEFYGEAGFDLERGPAERAFNGLLADPRLGRILLIEDDGLPAGYVVLTLGYSMEYGGLRGFVDDFFVRPSSRDRGLGAKALEAVKALAIDLDVRALLVETGVEGHPARRLYQRAGYEPNDRALLTLPLSPPVHLEA
jgi:GNAT superfamily N-acetyltransferase